MDDLLTLSNHMFDLVSTHIFSGKSDSVIAILILVCIGLLYDRRKLISKIDKLEEKNDQVTEDYYKATILISEALNGIKVVLSELKSNL